MSRSPTLRFRSTLYVDLAPGHAYDLLEDIATDRTCGHQEE